MKEPLELLVSTTGGPRLLATRTAGFLLFACSAIFVIAVTACMAMAPFLLEDNNLSSFGIHPPTSLIFNGTLIVVGVLTMMVAFCFGGRQAWLVAVLSVIAGASMIGAGVITVEIGRMTHAILAGVDYAGHLLLTIVFARSLRGGLRVTGYLAVALSLVFLLLWAFQAPFLFDTFEQAGTQFLTTLPLLAWVFAFSTRLMRSSYRQGARPRRLVALRLPWPRSRRLTNAG
jgi:hypothetical membrane protein